tara:strand:+ start:595 stop:768 length:174 start_codon:yes stop_codon:yes gene_type:complete
MIEIGTLVKDAWDEEIGIVTKVYTPSPDGRQFYKVKWFDGLCGDYQHFLLEVLNEKD